MTPQSSSLVRSLHKLNLLHLHLQKTRWCQTRYDADPPMKPHDPLNTWGVWGHVTNSKVLIFTIFLATKLGWVLTLRRRFCTQTLKSSPTSCFNFNCRCTSQKNLWFYLKNSAHCFPFILEQKVNKSHRIILNYYHRNQPEIIKNWPN